MIWPALETEQHTRANEDDSVAAAHPPVSVLAELTEQWTGVLDELETQLLMADPATPYWTPPRSLGNLPESLRERAGSLARSQAMAVTTLRIALEAASAELATLLPTRQTTSAVYLDVMG